MKKRDFVIIGLTVALSICLFFNISTTTRKQDRIVGTFGWMKFTASIDIAKLRAVQDKNYALFIEKDGGWIVYPLYILDDLPYWKNITIYWDGYLPEAGDTVEVVGRKCFKADFDGELFTAIKVESIRKVI